VSWRKWSSRNWNSFASNFNVHNNWFIPLDSML